MIRKLAVARFWFEGNAFTPVTTGLDAFQRREWVIGKASLPGRDAETELAAVSEFIATRPDWDVTVLRCASALPGGPIEEPVFHSLVEEIVEGLAGTRWDAVYLSLHGAAITTERDRPDLDLVRSVRLAIGDAPLGASFDLHANMSPDLVPLLTFASAYRTHPHLDMRETAARVIRFLIQVVESGRQPKGVLKHTRILLPSFNMRTGSGPMEVLQQRARSATEAPVCDVSIFGGFPYADTVHCGAAVLAYADEDAGAAARVVEDIAHAIGESREAFRVTLPGPHQAMQQALAAGSGLVAITDAADNPLSGGTADTPGLFRALLDARVQVPAVFAFFADGDIVSMAAAAGIGGRIAIQVGARRSRDFGASVPANAIVVRLTEGRFRNSGPMEHGLEVDFGRTALLQVDGIQLIVTEHCMPANDPAFFALHGIDLAATRILCVKAKNHFRAAFQAVCRRIIDCDAPGPASADLTLLPFRNIRPR
ncbi:MAG: M81 family peptidase [Betaproteobacteria bacterium]|nr:M81 family peptidase [Betaproteobacteria bacterium]